MSPAHGEDGARPLGRCRWWWCGARLAVRGWRGLWALPPPLKLGLGALCGVVKGLAWG